MEATRILMEEHRVIERVLSALQTAAQRVVQGEEMRPAFFINAALFIKNFADGCHHRKEEGVLFKALQELGMPVEGGPLGMMLAEHAQGRLFTVEMKDAAQKWDLGDTSARGVVAHNAQGYVDLLRQHIQKEDGILFPLADRIIPVEKQAMLATEFERIEREETGEGFHEKYLALVDVLESEFHPEDCLLKTLEKILLFLTGLLAAYQVAIGINAADTLPLIAYTVGFGVLLVAGLLLIILGLDVLDSPLVVIVSTIIPLALSLGLVWEHIPAWRIAYLVFVLLGFLAIVVTRLLHIRNKLPVLILAVVHGIAGLTIFLLPLIWAFTGRATHGFAFVGVGGALIGLGGLLLAFLKAGKPLLSRAMIFNLLPVLLLLMTIAFVLGFALA